MNVHNIKLTDEQLAGFISSIISDTTLANSNIESGQKNFNNLLRERLETYRSIVMDNVEVFKDLNPNEFNDIVNELLNKL